MISLSVLDVSHGVRWRTSILYDKAVGRLPDIDWAELVAMLRPGSDIYLEDLARTRNPYVVIQNPRRSPRDLEAGGQLFLAECTSCHGAHAEGSAGGPDLRQRTFRQGRSDWAFYRTITRGIPGTAMVAKQLPRDDVWRLVAYLDQTLVGAESNPPADPAAALVSIAPVTADDLRGADDDPGEWLTYSGSYQSHRYSRLAQIDRRNVGRIEVAWQRQFATADERLETSPIIRGTTMFVTEPPNRVHALDAATGRILWTYAHPLPAKLLLCCRTVNRGVAILGDRIFLGTLDAHLIALDASSGKVAWDVAVADPSNGYSITGAPLAVEDMVLTGVAGGEFGAPGFIDAYDAVSGKRRWRFSTIPGPGEPGSETWQGDSLRNGGAPTWLTGSFDPELRLVYWGVGNPSPNFFGDNRKGDDLYSNSVVALDAGSGRLRWHFQFTPHDVHDWDSVQIPVVIDAVIGTSKRKLLVWANRNGFYYVLDRASGEFLAGTPFVRQSWTDGLDAQGRPRTRPESMPSREGSIVYPGVQGGTNWWSPSYDPELQLLYVPTLDWGSVFYATPGRAPQPDGQILGGASANVPDEDMMVAIKALEVATGRVRWQYARPPRRSHGDLGGLMSTAGGLVFGADNESFFALDAESGAELWHFDAGAQVLAAPVSYRLKGRQYVAIAAGRSILAFVLPPTE